MKKIGQRKCAECGSTRFAKIVEDDTHVVGKTKYVVEIPETKCLKCGDITVSGPDMERSERLVAAEIARSGPSTGVTFRYMRRALGLKSGDLAQLLGVRPETLSKWETDADRSPDRAAWATLAAIVTENVQGRRDTLDRLEALALGAKIPKVVHVDAG